MFVGGQKKRKKERKKNAQHIFFFFFFFCGGGLSKGRVWEKSYIVSRSIKKKKKLQPVPVSRDFYMYREALGGIYRFSQNKKIKK